MSADSNTTQAIAISFKVEFIRQVLNRSPELSAAEVERLVSKLEKAFFECLPILTEFPARCETTSPDPLAPLRALLMTLDKIAREHFSSLARVSAHDHADRLRAAIADAEALLAEHFPACLSETCCVREISNPRT